MRPTITFLTLLAFVSIFSLAVSAENSSGTLSDEFNDADTLSNWSIGTNSNEDLINIDMSTAGNLAWVPTDLNNNAWFQDFDAPFRYKTVSGNFLAEIYVNAGNVADPSQPPTGLYNSAGFLARDPASDGGIENWLMFNLGYQASGLATEGKTTVNSGSILTLIDATSQSGQLALCRAGDEFRMYRWLDDETDWTLLHTYTRPDLPDTLQLGLTVNAWRNRDLYAEFDYFRVDQSIATPMDCETNLSVPTAITLSSAHSSSQQSSATILVISVLIVLTIITITKSTPKKVKLGKMIR